MNWRGATVEVIRLIWHYGYFRSNVILKKICKNWFDCWVDYKTQQLFFQVDQQIRSLAKEPTVESPIFSEEKDGETELGGEMRLRSPWSEE